MKRELLLLKVKELGGFQSPLIVEKLKAYILEYKSLVENNSNIIDEVQLRQKTRVFPNKAKEKHKKHQRRYELFFEKEISWLRSEINLERTQIPLSKGRPKKSLEELGDRSKRAKVAELSCNPSEALIKAAFRAQQISGSGDASLVVLKASTSNNNTQQPSRMEAGEALSLKIQCNLSDQAYQMIRN